VAAAALLLLTACSGGGGSESAGGDSGPQSVEAPAEDLADGGGDGRLTDSEPAREAADGLTAGDEEGAARVAVEGGSFIRTGRITVESKDLDAARDAVDRLVERYGGHVADERTENEDDGAVRSSKLTLRVPSDSFATVMTAIGDLGAVQGSTTQEEDVTTEVIDVASRIRTQEVSLRRLRGFLDEARTVPAIIRLESEIARREADLASLRGQQDYLDDQTSLSTIELTLRTPAEKAATPEEEDPLENAGFLSGLSSGWNALLDVLLVIATVVGAMLPFVVVLVLLGVPLSVAIARARARSAARAGQGPSTA
jgi:hypothetical protein